ncbi:hypothetical protein F7734_43615 [Scytonema sp. UIC 10036]|uniref:hypothetical protein n=1 Tax=Scytonema sp. UIC 10036 TaxID=2304196 RepID=UPI0012DA0355|nr:hypothetical protein [Scytonema sp. UIC 10036]MUG98819.1 hypothetical protein [Scytonema sp. UIC 10036]
MKKAIFLILPMTLMVFPNFKVQAQRVDSSEQPAYLALVKGDTPNSCSFMSADYLERVSDIVEDLLFVRPDDSPEWVRYKVRFTPDREYARNALEWTGLAGGNYTKAVVNFRNNSVQSRTFTMAINYNQPNERQCQWEVREARQGIQPNSSTSSLNQ